MTKAKKVLQEAIRLVGGERSAIHGSISINHENIAHLWNGYLWNIDKIRGSDVANMMEILKVARRKLGSLNPDDYVDGAGYSAVSYECKLAEIAEFEDEN